MDLSKNLTITRLAHILAKQTGMPKKDCVHIVRLLFEEIKSYLTYGGMLYIPQFMKLYTRRQNQRVKHPKTREWGIFKNYPIAAVRWSADFKRLFKGRCVKRIINENKME